MVNSSALAPEERISIALRELYEKHGYIKYRMGKFENYDLYAENRSFLPDGGIITFTDSSGNLLAMKPDVTLSIANGLPTSPVSEKIYYNENVYRVHQGSREYKEIMQLGVECIGDIDLYSVCEVISLAAKSLESITGDYILDISHAGLVSGILDETGLNPSKRDALLECINRKDAHDILRTCEENGVRADVTRALTELAELYAPIGDALENLDVLDVNASAHSAITELKDIYAVLSKMGLAEKLFLDFSFADNTGYYDGVKFKGYVNGVFSAVLAGGSYGKLLKKLKKNAGAIGFAVYLDFLSEYGKAAKDFDADVLLLYSSADDVGDIMKAAERLISEGKSVRVEKNAPEGLRFTKTAAVSKGGVVDA